MAAAPEPGQPEKGKPFKLLGILDVENTPCARDSILYGSLGSVVAGLGHFLLTSRIRRSCDVGAGGFVVVTLGCWYVRRVFRKMHNYTTGSTVGIIMRSKGSRKELPEKELKIRFYMKVPTLILKENKATAATEQGRAEKPRYSSLLPV